MQDDNTELKILGMEYALALLEARIKLLEHNNDPIHPMTNTK
jgi:hypothetical protein